MFGSFVGLEIGDSDGDVAAVDAFAFEGFGVGVDFVGGCCEVDGRGGGERP